MLKRFTVKNYKNFQKEVCLDLEKTAGYQFSTDCITDGLISKMLIYGKNATGKTNLGRAVMNIKTMLLDAVSSVETEAFLNADSEEDAAVFSYIFDFNGRELVYRYAKFSEYRLKWEKLEINGTLIFECDFLEGKLAFPHLEEVEAETANVERYRQALEPVDGEQHLLSFLRWLVSNMALKDDSILIKLLNYVRDMTMVTVGNALTQFRKGIMTNIFFKRLEQENSLKNLEEFFNVMGINCRLVLKKLPDGQRELYFSHKKLVPFFENASSGTLALLDIYRKIITAIEKSSFVYMDEFDAFYHYEMAENLVRFFKKKYPRSQIIMTSHNTNLMTNRLMRPDCLFILSGEGTLTALCDATEREMREGHNLEKMYISGEFERYE
ncbi:MAG TPA: ATP-binding protein [Candidatus Eisenbergiella merdavium]|uniref:ATP-binding protein n=1 Tax=Candidatus Eisenbergiella merdavium TaxID=2838551 RepID=A0A9D2SQL4_9FIRM|nr:ATP-binding protein [Candidatus Eisenbergiella merdavium]